MSEWLAWWLLTGASVLAIGLFLWPAIYAE